MARRMKEFVVLMSTKRVNGASVQGDALIEVQIPISSSHGGRAAVRRKLEDRDAKSGKRLFLTVEEAASMSPAERVAATDHKPNVQPQHERDAERIVEQLGGASPSTLRALAEKLAPLLGFAPKAVDPVKHSTAADKSDPAPEKSKVK